MQLTADDIKEFQDIYESEFGEPLAAPEAQAIATQLMSLYECLSQPLPCDDLPALDESAANAIH